VAAADATPPAAQKPARKSATSSARPTSKPSRKSARSTAGPPLVAAAPAAAAPAAAAPDEAMIARVARAIAKADPRCALPASEITEATDVPMTGLYAGLARAALAAVAG
jgi:translation initiation factor IF-2